MAAGKEDKISTVGHFEVLGFSLDRLKDFDYFYDRTSGINRLIL